MLLLLTSLLSSPAFAQAPESSAEPSAETQPSCENPVSTEEISREVEVAKLSWTTLDIPFFVDATDNLKHLLPCVTEEVPTHIAADVLRTLGMRHYFDKDQLNASQAFASARIVQPYYRFPASLIPAGNPVIEVYGRVQLDSLTPIELEPPANGRMQINGALSLQRPGHWPAIVQLINTDGSVRSTSYLMGDKPMPTYEPAPPGAALNYRYDAKAIPLHVPLQIGAGVTGATAIGLYAMGLSAKSQFNSDSAQFEDVPQLHSRANSFTGAGVAVGAVALGLATSAVLTKRF